MLPLQEANFAKVLFVDLMQNANQNSLLAEY